MLKTLVLLVLLVLCLPAPARAEGEAAAGRPYYSIDYTTHASFGGAVVNSFAPTSYRANVGAVLHNTIEPLNPVRYVGAVALVELQKQVASGNGINVGKLLDKLDPAGLAGGYFGAQMGETLGAVAQTALARACGPVGGAMGFALRPILWLAGSSIGGEAARSLAHGEKGDPLKTGMAKTLREYNPIQDSVQMIGDNVGGVIGQALIPVPFVGMMCGACVGGVAGLLLGKAICQTGPGKALDDTLRSSMRKKADQLSPETAREGVPADDSSKPGSLIVPQINGATGPPPRSSAAIPGAGHAVAAGKASAAGRAGSLSQPAAPGSTTPGAGSSATGAPAAPVSTASRADIHKAYLGVQEAMARGDQKLLQQRLKEYQRIKEGR